ncbi:MAG TPA: 6-bladed beta-propeller [Solirubrobacterales bacterium]|jgi:sugar lactone lactonase YvrE
MSANEECFEAGLAGFRTALIFGLVLLAFAILPVSAGAESPGVTTESGEEVTTKAAILRGSVNPHGFATTYRFEYGTTTSYGTSVPVPDKSGGSGTSSVKVSEPISGLKSNTTYHFRIAAISAEGSSFGKDGTFSTKVNLPTVWTGGAGEFTLSTATLKGAINPNGLETKYRFEYGTTTSYGTSIPVPDKIAGSGTSEVEVSEGVGGLAPGTTYHFRLVGTSEEGTSFGEDRTFTTTDPRFSFAFGSEGSGNGQLSYPEGIEADSEGNIWVTDSGNNRVQKFNSSGEYLSKFGSKGGGNGQLLYPTDLAFDSSKNIWVADRDNSRIQKFESFGFYLSKFGSEGEGNGQFLYPNSIAIDSSKNIWISDWYNHRIQKFNSSGTYQFSVCCGGEEWLSYPAGIGVDSEDNVWIVDAGNNRVVKLDSAGEYLGEFGSYGSGNGEFYGPHSIAIDSDDNAWVVDRYNTRVQVFNSSGEYQGQFGSYSEEEEEDKFVDPTGIAIDSMGDVWVLDATRSQVLKWTFLPPTTTTEAADELTKETATLHGTVNPNGFLTTYRFEYGTTTSYGTSVPTPDEDIGLGMSTVEVDDGISGLKPATTYHFRVVATNVKGTSFGEDETFTTK